LKACPTNLWKKRKNLWQKNKSFAEELRSTVFLFKNLLFFLFFFSFAVFDFSFSNYDFCIHISNLSKESYRVLRSYRIYEIFSSHILIKIWTMMTEKRWSPSSPTTSYKRILHRHQYLSIVFQRTCLFSAYEYFFYAMIVCAYLDFRKKHFNTVCFCVENVLRYVLKMCLI